MSDGTEKVPPTDTVTLRDPVSFGDETVTELVVKPTARAFREFSLPMTQEGTIMYQPYALAKIGCQMSGRNPGFVDKLSVRDMNSVAQVVMGFLT